MSRALRKRRKAAALLLGTLALLVSGCADNERIERPRAWNADAVLTNETAEAVEVRVFDIPPGETIEDIRLVGPEGETARPTDVTERNRIVAGDSLARPTLGVGVVGGSSGRVSTGIGISVPIFSSRQATTGAKDVREIAAIIPIPDSEAYREGPEAWRIEITATDVSGVTRTRTFPAPRR